MDHLFVSIQTLNSKDLTEHTSADFYDVLIVDEFHHAAAPSYHQLLSYYRPRILLGLTATPERMDGKDILAYFDQRIAAEIRLPEAIERSLLCPFQYFGVTDTVDLDSLKWTRGGYEKSEQRWKGIWHNYANFWCCFIGFSHWFNVLWCREFSVFRYGIFGTSPICRDKFTG